MTIIISRKHHAAGGRDRAGPHAAVSGHRIFPSPLAGFWIDGSQDHLSALFSRPAAGEILHRRGLLGGASEQAALFQGKDVQQTGIWVVALPHPVGRAFYAGADPIALGRWILPRD